MGIGVSLIGIDFDKLKKSKLEFQNIWSELNTDEKLNLSVLDKAPDITYENLDNFLDIAFFYSHNNDVGFKWLYSTETKDEGYKLLEFLANYLHPTQEGKEYYYPLYRDDIEKLVGETKKHPELNFPTDIDLTFDAYLIDISI